jgi:acyl-coenzyme A synthetase/AMP-(fatty) acid ligase
MTESQVIELLRREVDPLFLPRPLVLVDALPRNDVGKLPRKLALELLGSAAAHRHQHPAGTG